MHALWLRPASIFLAVILPVSALAAPAAKPVTAVVPVRGAPASFADLSAQLLPTVVNIATSQTLKPAANVSGLPNLPPGSPLSDLFKDFLGPGRTLPQIGRASCRERV